MQPAFAGGEELGAAIPGSCLPGVSSLETSACSIACASEGGGLFLKLRGLYVKQRHKGAVGLPVV
jgi:hypothetical protein